MLLTAIILFASSAWAQKEFKVAKTTGRLNLNINGAIIEGYNGNEIVFTTQQSDEEVVDERAKGLQALSGSGFVDNTGLGLDVATNGQDINVNVVGKKLNGILTIKVPQNVKVYFSNTRNIYHDEIILKNLKNEIEVSATYNKIKLENNSGPMNIKSVYGSIDAIFEGEIKGPVSIISVYNYVDISLPASTKANVELGTSYGKLYAADQFKIAIDKNSGWEDRSGSETSSGKETNVKVNGVNVRTGTANNAVTINGKKSDEYTSILGFSGNGTVIMRGTSNLTIGERIKGTINGGGVDLIFKSNYKNVYLRQK